MRKIWTEDELIEMEHFSILLETGEGDPSFLKNLMDSFESNAKALLGDLGKAVEVNDIEKLKFCGHKIKGSAGAVGAKLLMDLAKDFEVKISEKAKPSELSSALEIMLAAFDSCLQALRKKMG